MNTTDTAPSFGERMRAHRLTLGPFYFAALLAAAGGLATLVRGTWSTWAVLTAGLVAAMPAWAWAATRLRRPWRRRYSYACLTAAVGWLVLVHAGTFDDPELWLVLLGGVLLGGIPWWSDQVRRDKVRIEGELAAWEEIAARIGLGGTRWTHHVEQPGRGWTAKLVWPPGLYSVEDVLKKRDRIEGARGLPVGSLRLARHGRETNRVDAFAVVDDPHTQAIEWPGPSKPEGGSVTDPTALGLQENEQPVTVQRFRTSGARRVLIAGASDSGKSGMINHLVGEDACCDDVALLLMDLKGGMELSPWSGIAAWTVTTVAGALEMCAALEAAIEARMADCSRRKVRVWTPSRERPAIHVYVDELRRVAASRSGRTVREARETLDRLVDLATMGRAVGISLIGATQYPTLEALGSSQIRTQMDVRMCFRVQNQDEAGFTIPDHRPAAHLIPADRPGTFYLQDGDRYYELPVRGYFWPDELVAEVAALRAGACAWLDEPTEQAMAKVAPLFAAALEERDSGGGSDAEPGPEDVPAWTDVSDGPDVPLSRVVAGHAARTGEPVPARLSVVPGPAPGDDEAQGAMWLALVQAGADGATAKDLYTAVGRSSSWFHPIMRGWLDAGWASRTRRGRYAVTGPGRDPRTLLQSSTNGHAR